MWYFELKFFIKLRLLSILNPHWKSHSIFWGKLPFFYITINIRNWKKSTLSINYALSKFKINIFFNNLNHYLIIIYFIKFNILKYSYLNMINNYYITYFKRLFKHFALFCLSVERLNVIQKAKNIILIILMIKLRSYFIYIYERIQFL